MRKLNPSESNCCAEKLEVYWLGDIDLCLLRCSECGQFDDRLAIVKAHEDKGMMAFADDAIREFEAEEEKATLESGWLYQVVLAAHSDAPRSGEQVVQP